MLIYIVTQRTKVRVWAVGILWYDVGGDGNEIDVDSRAGPWSGESEGNVLPDGESWYFVEGIIQVERLRDLALPRFDAYIDTYCEVTL